MRLRKSTCPAPSAPCTWNTCFAMSNPIVLTCSTDASFGGSLTPPPWHTDAVGGRPLHHSAWPFVLAAAKVAYGARRVIPTPEIERRQPVGRETRQRARC